MATTKRVTEIGGHKFTISKPTKEETLAAVLDKLERLGRSKKLASFTKDERDCHGHYEITVTLFYKT